MKKLKYGWVDYSKDYREIVESFLDDEAIKSTGCDDGFEAFYTYWMSEEDTRLNENFWFKVISTDQKPIAIIAIAKSPQNEFTVSEFIIAPTERRKGHGKAILKELLSNSSTILGERIDLARAVIFPSNIASQKAFAGAHILLYIKNVGNATAFFDFCDFLDKKMNFFV